MRIRPIKFDDAAIPAWTYQDKEPSIYTFVEAITLAGLEDKAIRLSAEMQRKLLGFPVFGKRSFIIHKDGMFHVFGAKDFTGDWETMHEPQSYIGIAAKRQQQLDPRSSGSRYFNAYAYEHEHEEVAS